MNAVLIATTFDITCVQISQFYPKYHRKIINKVNHPEIKLIVNISIHIRYAHLLTNIVYLNIDSLINDKRFSMSTSQHGTVTASDTHDDLSNTAPFSSLPGPSPISFLLSNLPGGIFRKSALNLSLLFKQ